MPSLSRTEVEQIALLARLRLEDAEIAKLQDELGAILEHFGALAQVDTAGVAPMTHAVPMELAPRADEPAPSLPTEQALRGAPARDGDLFVVPAIIPGGAEP